MRLPIRAAFFMLILCILFFSTLTFIELRSANSSFFESIQSLSASQQGKLDISSSIDYKFIILIIKQALSLFALIAVFLVYIRWEDRWMQSHADSEFQTKKFALDIERANWLVETGLEWRDIKGTTMPPELMISLSKNLFDDQKTAYEEKIKPLNQLASSILGSASLIKMKSGDTEIEVDPKKLSKQKPISVD